MARELTAQELHALPDKSLLNVTQAARLLNLHVRTFSRLVDDGVLEEARIELRPNSPRFWKQKLLEAVAALNKPARAALEASKPAAAS